MHTHRVLLFLIFCIWFVPVGAQSPAKFVAVKDLHDEWLTFDGNGYRKYSNQKVNVIYFNLDGKLLKGDFLYLNADARFDVFVNQKLITSGARKEVRLNIDSLARLYTPALWIGVFQSGGVRSLQSYILVPAPVPPSTDSELRARKKNYFLDFSLSAALMLSVYFVLLFRTNPRLTLDYLNVSKLLSVHEREENLLAIRVTSSANLLFYLFCSAFCGLVMLVIFHFGDDQVWVAQYFPIHSTGDGFFQWGKVSAMVMGWLALKLMIIYFFSGLFNLKEISAIQYFNFIRMLFMVTGIMATICVAYFVYYGYSAGPHANLLKVSLLVMACSVVMIFLKLLTLAPFTFFHLFSYLCASEIIPLVILLKVLLY